MIRRRARFAAPAALAFALVLGSGWLTAAAQPVRVSPGPAQPQDPPRMPARIPDYAGAAEDYARTCEGCHLGDGSGMPGLVPRLRGFIGYFTHLPEGREFLARVPGVSLALLDDERLTGVLNWTLYAFSPDELVPGFQPYTVEEIARLRARPLDSIQATRAALIARLREMGVIPPDEDGVGPHVLR